MECFEANIYKIILNDFLEDKIKYLSKKQIKDLIEKNKIQNIDKEIRENFDKLQNGKIKFGEFKFE